MNEQHDLDRSDSHHWDSHLEGSGNYSMRDSLEATTHASSLTATHRLSGSCCTTCCVKRANLL